jgi:hypothetical protein
VGIRIVPYTAEHIPAVKDFNTRLDQSHAGAFRLSEQAPEDRQYCEGIGFRHLLAVDENAQVRGGYYMRLQPMLVRGSIHSVGEYGSPLSEGIIDKRYTTVGLTMLIHAIRSHPLLFASGMGGLAQPLPRMMKSMKWRVLETPFWFRVIHGSRFLRNIGPLRKDLPRRIASDLLAFTGLGAGGIALAQRFRTKASPDASLRAEPLVSFDDWAAEVWSHSCDQYVLSAVRTPDYLRFNYPLTGAPYTSLKLTQGGHPVGWVNLLDCQPQNASYFGNMKVAALIDGVAPPRFVPALVSAAVRAAKKSGADLLFTNQTHHDWNTALRNAGFWQGPSNYLLGLSEALVRLLEPIEEAMPRIHFNRGDGHGRANLISQTTTASNQEDPQA